MLKRKRKGSGLFLKVKGEGIVPTGLFPGALISADVAIVIFWPHQAPREDESRFGVTNAGQRS